MKGLFVEAEVKCPKCGYINKVKTIHFDAVAERKLPNPILETE
jgi:phage FluMu protein Com